MAKWINRYMTRAEYTSDRYNREDLGKTVSLIASEGTMSYEINQANPLGLPDYTMRLKYKAGTEPKVGTKTLVDPGQNIWDVTIRNSDWHEMFKGERDLLEVLGGNTRMVTNFSQTFFQAFNLEKVNTFDTRNSTNFSGLFQQTKISTAPMLNTGNGTQLGSMFSGCTNLLYVPMYNLASAVSVAYMFQDCSYLTTVPLFNTSNVMYMNHMFNGCSSLTKVPLFDTSSVTSMQYMFQGCSSLTTVPLFNTSSATNMESMFQDCSSLTTVPLFNTSSAKRMSSMFKGCSSLTAVPLFDTSNVMYMSSMFYNCTNVEHGAYDLYQRASTQTTPPSSYSQAFTNCGSNTTTGQAELAQIPTSWGGTKS